MSAVLFLTKSCFYLVPPYRVIIEIETDTLVAVVCIDTVCLVSFGIVQGLA